MSGELALNKKVAKKKEMTKVTLGSLIKSQRAKVDKMFEDFTAKWGQVPVTVIEDVDAILKDKESLKPTQLIFEDTLEAYKEGSVEYIQKSYNLNCAWKGFLEKFSNHDFYRQILQQPDPLLTTCDVLGNIIQKISGGGTGGGGTGGGGGQGSKEQDEAARNFQNIIEYGRTILELMEDPTMQEVLNPGGGGSGDGDEDKDDEKQEGDGDDNDQEQDGDGQGEGEGQYSNGCGGPMRAFQKLMKFNPYVIEVMDLCTKFDFVMRLRKEGIETSSENPEDGLSVRRMQSSKEVNQILPGQLALPSDIFYPKFARRELLIKEYTTKREHKQCLYICLDASGSMGCSNRKHITDPKKMEKDAKFVWASSVAISYLRRVVNNGDVFGLSFFAGKPYGEYMATDKKSAAGVIKAILNEGFDGGDTDIQCAIVDAADKIKRAEKKDLAIKEADILLITDGGSAVNADFVKKILDEAKIKLHTVIIGGGNMELKKISENFLTVKDEEGFFKLAKMLNN